MTVVYGAFKQKCIIQGDVLVIKPSLITLTINEMDIITVTPVSITQYNSTSAQTAATTMNKLLISQSILKITEHHDLHKAGLTAKSCLDYITIYLVSDKQALSPLVL